MFCIHCGTKAASEDRFCNNCGKALPSPEAETSAAPVSQPTPPANQPAPSTSEPDSAESDPPAAEEGPPVSSTAEPIAVNQAPELASITRRTGAFAIDLILPALLLLAGNTVLIYVLEGTGESVCTLSKSEQQTLGLWLVGGWLAA
jgi:hypothetical protein